MSGKNGVPAMSVSPFCHAEVPVYECDRHENDLRDYGPCFRLRDRHGRDHHHCADRVMTDLLMFLGRGFALFAGGPAVIYQHPALSRSAAVVEARKRGEGRPE